MELVAGAGAVVLAAVAVLWWQRGPGQARTGHPRPPRRAGVDEGRALAQHAAARDALARTVTASDAGRPVPVRRSGTRPVTVRYSDGTTRFFFEGDSDLYREAYSSGRYDPSRLSLDAAPETPEH